MTNPRRVLALLALLFTAGCPTNPTNTIPDGGGNGDGSAPPADMTSPRAFPSTFLWGSATSSHQVEGGNTNNDWYAWEMLGGKIANDDKSGRADDNYTLFDQDLALAQAMGHNAYRFSVEWARLEPTPGVLDMKEVDHYKAVIAACKKRGLKPIVTLHHFTLPLWVLDPTPNATSLGGWTNVKTVDAFVSFVTRVVPLLSTDVDTWITINEPLVQISNGYFFGSWPPGGGGDFTGAITASRNMIDAHVRAYDAIHAAYGTKPVTVTIAMHYLVVDPVKSPDDDAASANIDYVFNQLFLNAVIKGDIDTDLKGTIEHRDDYKNKLDVIGVNYYKRNLVSAAPIGPIQGLPGEDTGATYMSDVGWGLYPEGMLRCLRDLWKRYKLPLIITENGLADAQDKYRPWFIVTHLQGVQQAMAEGIDVRGYLHWSLLDNFEWALGFAPRFGLVAVDYTNSALPRTPRPSAQALTAILQAGAVTPDIVTKYGKAP